MATVSIEIKGLDKIQEGFKRFPKETEAEMRAALQKSVVLLQATVRPLTPIDTGRLRSGHRVQVGAFEAKIFNPVNYAIYVHDGTRRMKGRPFYDMAAREDKKQIEQIFDRHFENIINKI